MTKSNIGPQADPNTVYRIEKKVDGGNWELNNEGTLPCGLGVARSVIAKWSEDDGARYRIRQGDIIWAEVGPVYRHPAWSKQP